MLHVRGFVYSEVRQTLSRKHNSLIPLSALAALFFSATKASAHAKKEIERLANTLTAPFLVESSLSPSYFSKAEATLYLGILLCYACVTPGLRIHDLVPCDARFYNQFQTSITTPIRTLQKFKNRYPSILKTPQLDYLSSTIPANTDQNQRFQHFIYLATQTLSFGSFVEASFYKTASTISSNLAITEGGAAVEPNDEVWRRK